MDLVSLAVEQGGTKLDCFDTVLPEIYSVNGFKVVQRDAWNETYAPEGWDKKTFEKYNNGEPDVVYMQHDPAHNPFAVNDEVFYQSLSTRVPRGKGSIENHLEDVLTIDLEVAKRDPKAFEERQDPAVLYQLPHRQEGFASKAGRHHCRAHEVESVVALQPDACKHASTQQLVYRYSYYIMNDGPLPTRSLTCRPLACWLYYPQRDWFRDVSLAAAYCSMPSPTSKLHHGLRRCPPSCTS